MALSPPLPVPLVYGQKVLVNSATYFRPEWSLHYDLTCQASAISDLNWRLVMVRWQRSTPSGTVEDTANMTLNIAHITNGQINATWNAPEYATVDTHLTALVTNIAGLQHSGHVCSELRYYLRTPNPDRKWGDFVYAKDPGAEKPPDRYTDSGPPLHVHPLSVPGTNTAAPLPYQVSCSVTFKTPVRKHWGRVYIPGVDSTQADAFGRLTSGAVAAIANSFAKCVKDLSDVGYMLMVPHTQFDSLNAAAFSGTVSVQVDDVLDVIRRRRPKEAAIHTTGVPS